MIAHKHGHKRDGFDEHLVLSGLGQRAGIEAEQPTERQHYHDGDGESDEDTRESCSHAFSFLVRSTGAPLQRARQQRTSYDDR